MIEEKRARFQAALGDHSS